MSENRLKNLNLWVPKVLFSNSKKTMITKPNYWETKIADIDHIIMRTLNLNMHGHDNIIVTKTFFHKHHGKYKPGFRSKLKDYESSESNKQDDQRKLPKSIDRIPCSTRCLPWGNLSTVNKTETQTVIQYA